MRTLFSFFLLFSFTSLEAGFFSDLFEQQNPTQEREFEEIEEAFDTNVFEDEKVFSENDFEEFEEDVSAVASKSIFLSFQHFPKKVYLHQHFAVDIKAVVTTNVKSIGTQFVSGKNFTVLNENAPWKIVGEKSYTNRYLLKITNEHASLPTFKVTTQDRQGKHRTETLKPNMLKVVALKENELFSSILAKDFNLVRHHEKHYDDKHNIILLEINATGANLEDFHLPFATRQGIDTIKEDHDFQNIFYFAIVPKYTKVLKFKYFDLNTNKFKRITFPIIVADSSISTQTDLNPQKSKYVMYKIILSLVLAFVLFLLYLRYKKVYWLVLALAIALYTIYTKLITTHISLPKDMIIRILPTENSTVFFKTSQKMQVKSLLKKNGYTKILLPNTKIGWIKDADLSKN